MIVLAEPEHSEQVPMTIFSVWQDFVLDRGREGQIRTFEERIAVERATTSTEATERGWDPSLLRRLITKSDIVLPGDDFEAMSFDDHGNVIIWTMKRVWYVRVEDGKKERLRSVPRNPSNMEANSLTLRGID
jgi:hypothetical protein